MADNIKLHLSFVLPFTNVCTTCNLQRREPSTVSGAKKTNLWQPDMVVKKLKGFALCETFPVCVAVRVQGREVSICNPMLIQRGEEGVETQVLL